MSTIFMTVSGTEIRVAMKDYLAAGTVGMRYEASYDSSWEGLSKVVVFSNGSITRNAVDGTVPHEVLASPNKMLRVGVVGRQGDGKIVVPTVWADVGIVFDAAKESGDPTLEPDNPVWAQSAVIAQDALTEVQELKRRADSGEFQGPPGPGYEHSQEFSNLADQIRADAVSAGNAAKLSGQNASHSAQFANDAQKQAERAETAVSDIIRLAGKSVRAADMDPYCSAFSQWESWGGSGYSTTWPLIRNTADFSAGDIAVIPGKVTDYQNSSCQWYGKVTAVGDDSLTCTWLGWIHSGKDGAAADLSQYAELDSPSFNGNPTAPTPVQGSNDNTIATTAFVKKALNPQILSPNIFDKSKAAPKKVFYRGGSGIQLINDNSSFAMYVPLRGAGHYVTKFNKTSTSASQGPRVAICREDNTFLKYITGSYQQDSSDGTLDSLEFDVDAATISAGGVKYAYDCMYKRIDEVMIIKGDHYPDHYIPYGYIDAPDDRQKNILTGKTALFFGDSICAGTTVGQIPEYGWGWAGLIGTENNMTWHNYGQNGGVTATISGQRVIEAQLDTAKAAFPEADYIILEGGVNDADQIPDKLGTFSQTEFSTFDKTTFSGGLEALILKAQTLYPNAKIGFIVPQRQGQPPYDSTGHYYKFLHRAIEICRKWGIPCIDLWTENQMTPKLSIYWNGTADAQSNIAQGMCYIDGQHLTLKGYQRLQQPITKWMMQM